MVLCNAQGNIIPISAVLTPPSAAMAPAKNSEVDPSAPIGAATAVSNVTVNDSEDVSQISLVRCFSGPAQWGGSFQLCKKCRPCY